MEAYLGFPFELTPQGGVRTSSGTQHIRERMIQVLFTSPGERVMLPEFGSGVRDLVFSPNRNALAAAAEFQIAKSLQAHMSDLVMINAVQITNDDAKLLIQIVYTRTADLEEESVVFRLDLSREGVIG